MLNATNTPVDTTDCICCWKEVPETTCCPECGNCLTTCCTCQVPEAEPEETFEPRQWRHEQPFWNITRP